MMKIIVTDEAIQWFKNEMDLQAGDHIRFFARYGGSNPFHEGYSIGMNTDIPINAIVTTTAGGLHFFIEEDDEWFFAGHDFQVTVDQELDEISYDYL
ncbi:HesB/YadR/YfhF family protein [Kurthia sibirica]|nr:HesB/YadR/YfhF family protein [Kurthia sibirica]GEK35262.1 hypothetical protein KSI01_27950 [Kurthia sibirica]